jgi:hypothetical protein
MADQENSWWDNDQVISTVASIGRLKSIIKSYSVLAQSAENNLKNA